MLPLYTIAVLIVKLWGQFRLKSVLNILSCHLNFLLYYLNALKLAKYARIQYRHYHC